MKIKRKPSTNWRKESANEEGCFKESDVHSDTNLIAGTKEGMLEITERVLKTKEKAGMSLDVLRVMTTVASSCSALER